jgi:hypothetical protein
VGALGRQAGHFGDSCQLLLLGISVLPAWRSSSNFTTMSSFWANTCPNEPPNLVDVLLWSMWGPVQLGQICCPMASVAFLACAGAWACHAAVVCQAAQFGRILTVCMAVFVFWLAWGAVVSCEQPEGGGIASICRCIASIHRQAGAMSEICSVRARNFFVCVLGLYCTAMATLSFCWCIDEAA